MSSPETRSAFSMSIAIRCGSIRLYNGSRRTRRAQRSHYYESPRARGPRRSTRNESKIEGREELRQGWLTGSHSGVSSLSLGVVFASLGSNGCLSCVLGVLSDPSYAFSWRPLQPWRLVVRLLLPFTDQPAVLREVPDRLLLLVQLVVGQRQVVMAVRQAGVGHQGRFIGLHRLRLAVHVVEQHAEVVEQQRVVAAGLDRVAVGLLGIRQAVRLVQQPSEIDVGLEMRGVGGDGLSIGLRRRQAILGLENDRPGEPVTGARGRRGRPRAVYHAQRALVGVALERQQVLA